MTTKKTYLKEFDSLEKKKTKKPKNNTKFDPLRKNKKHYMQTYDNV